MYILGLRLSTGVGVSLTDVSERKNQRLTQKLRFACAFAELRHGVESSFPAEGILEFDATRTSLLKKRPSGKQEHVGRMMVACHRQSGERFFTPLPPRSTALKARPPPERSSEAWPILDRHTQECHIVSTDSARAFTGFFAAKRPKTPYGHVVHRLGQYTALAKIPLSAMTPAMREYAKTLPATSGNTLRFQTGDQQAECHFSKVKGCLKKMDLPTSHRTNKQACLNFLASAWLYRHPGLSGVCAALERHTKAMVDRVEPRRCFVGTEWLDEFSAEPAASNIVRPSQ
jgi:hypothetical protein